MLTAVLMNDLTQTKAKHIPYKGNTQAVADTIGGQVAFTWQGFGGVIPLIKSGRLRALAVSSATRSESIPDVPTGREAGVPGLEISSWMGMIGPKGMPQAAVQTLSDEVVRIVRTPEYKDFCEKNGMTVDLMDHKAFQADMPREQEKWKRIIALAQSE
ncbi:MAG: tripartite tricarboxylate transporter substrate binding protein [Pseudomonadota bacterium]